MNSISAGPWSEPTIDTPISGNWRSLKARLTVVFFATALIMIGSVAASAQMITFEPPTYTTGNINGQDGWTKTGPFDSAVAASAVSSFGSQSLRMSNAVTSGSFGDQTFSRSVANAAGETTADPGTTSGGTRMSRFVAEWQFASAVPGAEQPGLSVVASPDRGDGARMSWVQMMDTPTGLQINFNDYQQALGDFQQTTIASGLARNTAHTIRIEMDFVEGAANDVVRVFVDGTLAHTGTSWEDYYRDFEEVDTRTVDSILFRTAGTAAPETSGQGFFIDNLQINTPATHIVDDNSSCAGAAYTTVAAAIAAANPFDEIRICPGTYPTAATMTINKRGLKITAAEATKPVLQIAKAQGFIFMVLANDVTLNGLEVQKTDVDGVHNLIQVQGTNFTATNNLIYGPYPGNTWNGANIVSRAFEISGGAFGLNISNNTIHTLRQPAYINGGSGIIANNHVYGTKGWNVAGGVFNFTGNSWGTPENQDCDIGLYDTVNAADYPTRLQMSQDNNNAFICAQYSGGELGRAISYVGSASPITGSAGDPHATIQAGVSGTLAGGTVVVGAGTYVEDVLINKALTLVGAGPSTTTISGAIGGDNATVRIGASNVTVSGFTITREGNTPAQWTNTNLNSAGVAVQGQAITNALIHGNVITGNRTGIDINHSNGQTVRNNVIDNNRTGMILRNQTDNLVVAENAITNNWTAGIVFLNQASGPNPPLQQALGSTFSNNNISGNWYGQIVDRQTGGGLPAPGANPKNFRGNWLGTTTPVVTDTAVSEPGYDTQIPTIFGGPAANPGGQPDISGIASANVMYKPMLTSGTDTNVETTAGRGTLGFQGAPVVVNTDSLDGWTFYSEGAVSSGGFVGGPAGQPLGTGSANLTVDANGRHGIATVNYAGTRLDDITHLRYRSHQVSGNPAVAPALQLDIDYDVTDANTAWQGRLVYEPYMSGSVQQNTWQTWNPLAGNWWSSGAPGNTVCPQSNPCTWAEVLAAFPNSAIRPTNGILHFKAGGPVGSSGMVSHVDGFEIGVNTGNTTFDFEPSRPTVTINQASGQADPTSTGPVNFTVQFSQAVTGFNSADIVLGGTAGATTAVVTGSGATYQVAVSGMTGSGTVTASVIDSAAINASNAPSTASTSTDNSVTYLTCNNVSIPTGITSLRNQQVVVPIMVDDLTGRGVFTSDFTITYNSAVLSYVGNGTAGTIADNSTITVNSLTPGTLVVSVFNGGSDFTGSGVFLNLRFMANGAIGTTSAMNISSFVFNNGVPCVTTSNGDVTIISSTVSGRVQYANSPTTKYVPGAVLTGVGATGPTVSDTTDTNGQYELSGFGAGSYTVTPAKSGDVNGITSFDAGQVARHTVGLITLNSNQLVAADVSQDATVNSFDAGNIARFIVNNPSHAATGTWRFIPANRTYPNVETALANQDYNAVLLGDVDGSWTAPTPFAVLREAPIDSKDNVRISAPRLSAEPGSVVEIPIHVENIANKGVFDYQFELAYDKNILEAEEILTAVEGTVSEGLSVVAHSPEQGVLRVAVFGVTPITSDGILLNLRLGVIGEIGSGTPLTIREFIAGDGSPFVTAVDGHLNIERTADALISGTLRSAGGTPVSKTRVVLTGVDGSVRSTFSGPFGTFSFGGLTVGQSYTINVRSKRYSFAPRTIGAEGNSVNVDMIAEQ